MRNFVADPPPLIQLETFRAEKEYNQLTHWKQHLLTLLIQRWEAPFLLEFLGPQIALTLYRLDAISQGPKKSPFPGPIPSHLPT